MKTLFLVLLGIIIIAIAYYFLIYKNSSSTKLPNGGITPTPLPTYNPQDYIVNGDPVHDKEVVKKGISCARSFMYGNTKDLFVNIFYSLIGKPAFAMPGVDVSVLIKIYNLASDKKQLMVDKINAINVDNDWNKYALMAIGNKNMCSIILEDIYKQI